MSTANELDEQLDENDDDDDEKHIYDNPNDDPESDFVDDYDDFDKAQLNPLENIPLGLQNLPQWVAYKTAPRDNGKLAKIPINPHNGQNAKQDDPSTWGTFPGAVAATRQYSLPGIGFEFGLEFSGYVGVDLDNVVQEDGILKPFAYKIVKTLNSYTEYSPSRKGLHIICKSATDMESWDDNIRYRNDNFGIEMYDQGRFFTFTGDMFDDVRYRTIEERTEVLKNIYSEYLQQHNASKSSTTSIPDEDRRTWLMMSHSKNGEKIRALFAGDISDYNDDDSRADLALCNYLAYWTNGNVQQMDRMFRQSKLMRAKWYSGNNPTYGERTINKAIEGYLQSQPNAQLPSVENFSTDSMEQAATPPESSLTGQNEDADEFESVSKYIDGSFLADIAEFQKASKLKTGFENLDMKTSLMPGIYLLGAIPGLGKTTFCSQLADQQAINGQHILYFSLEQTRRELVSKGLSRITAGFPNKSSTPINGLTGIEVQQLGVSDDRVRTAMNTYKNFTQNEHFITRNFSSISDIEKAVERYIKLKCGVPIVFIDYLQIIKPDNADKATTKDVIDRHVQILKKLQAEYQLVCIIISSFNRVNYTAPVDFESFKESGGIEYTADVVWGLQLQAIHALSDKKNAAEKRDKINEAKNAIPRKIELACIKNRFGPNYSVCFDYYAQFDLFVPTDTSSSSNQKQGAGKRVSAYIS